MMVICMGGFDDFKWKYLLRLYENELVGKFGYGYVWAWKTIQKLRDRLDKVGWWAM